MEQEILDTIHGLDGIGLGRAIIFVVVIIAMGVAVYQFVKRVHAGYKKYILSEDKRKRDFVDTVNNMDGLVTMVANIAAELKVLKEENHTANEEIESNIEEIKRQLEEVRKQSEHGDVIIQEVVEDLTVRVKTIVKTVNGLVESDIERGRSEIVACYNEYVVPNKPIDIYTYANIKERYARYQAEGGNHYIAELMPGFDRLERNMLNAAIVDNDLSTIHVIPSVQIDRED